MSQPTVYDGTGVRNVLSEYGHAIPSWRSIRFDLEEVHRRSQQYRTCTSANKRLSHGRQIPVYASRPRVATEKDVSIRNCRQHASSAAHSNVRAKHTNMTLHDVFSESLKMEKALLFPTCMMHLYQQTARRQRQTRLQQLLITWPDISRAV